MSVLLNIISWILGVIALLASIILLVQGFTITGIIFFILSLYLFSPTRTLIKKFFSLDGRKQITDNLKNKTLESNKIETSNTISELVSEAGENYPNKNPQKAYQLFKEAIELAPNAPKDNYEMLEDIDVGDIGFACWAVYVLYDILHDGDFKTRDFLDLLDLIAKKSPLTASRVSENLEHSLKESEEKDKLEEIEEKILDIARTNPTDNKSISELIKEYHKLCQSLNEWWVPKEFADLLVKENINLDFVWGLYNLANYISMKSGGNRDSIYHAMAKVRKKENAYDHAAQLYLSAYAENQSTENSEQIRICLKKFGLKDAKEKRDLIIGAYNTDGRDVALNLLRNTVKQYKKDLDFNK